MIEQNNIIHPYAFEIKKQCILNIAYMVLKLTKDDMEDHKYIKDEYQFVEKNEVTKDVAEQIIETIVKEVIEEHSKENCKNDSFWQTLKFF